MLIPVAFLTTEIRETDNFKEDEMVFMKVAVPINQLQPVVSTQGTHRVSPGAHRIEPRSHKNNPEVIDDDDDDKEREKKDDEMGSLKEFKAHAPVIIEELFKNHVQTNVIHVYPTTTTSTKTKSPVNLQYQLYLKMKRNLQDRADDIALWEALRRKFKKSSSNTFCKKDDFHSHHDEHQNYEAPPEGRKE
uniref:Uncharacterized protein n=1 Tax=Tanacetum cinerariifolium TaxID=118510 RepID=A0A699IIP6_TANCI|nr:hypothetical protein [Tanacetum cinerariifolium]